MGTAVDALAVVAEEVTSATSASPLPPPNLGLATHRSVMDPTSSAAIARKTWELENNIPAAATDPDAMDAIYRYDDSVQARTQQEKPWAYDPHHFRRAKISALALLKMVVHACAGGTIEVMGLMQGKCEGDTIIVMDAFALPVEGTETRVNAHADAYEYMVEYSTINKQAGRLENVVGWYHSHPGYGCWLSGIDVSTQMLNQQFTEPFLAVVIDPTRTVSAGKVEIGAFRTYPKDYKPPDEPVPVPQTIPLNKIEDFGVHCKSYYALDITYFKSSLDSQLFDVVWNKYWVNTLSSSPLLGNRDYVAGQIFDLADKLEQAEGQLAHHRFDGVIMPLQRNKEQEESLVAKITQDSSKITAEHLHGLISQVVKDIPSSNTSTSDPHSSEGSNSLSKSSQVLDAGSVFREHSDAQLKQILLDALANKHCTLPFLDVFNCDPDDIRKMYVGDVLCFIAHLENNSKGERIRNGWHQHKVFVSGEFNLTTFSYRRKGNTIAGLSMIQFSLKGKRKGKGKRKRKADPEQNMVLCKIIYPPWTPKNDEDKEKDVLIKNDRDPPSTPEKESASFEEESTNRVASRRPSIEISPGSTTTTTAMASFNFGLLELADDESGEAAVSVVGKAKAEAAHAKATAASTGAKKARNLYFNKLQHDNGIRNIENELKRLRGLLIKLREEETKLNAHVIQLSEEQRELRVMQLSQEQRKLRQQQKILREQEAKLRLMRKEFYLEHGFPLGCDDKEPQVPNQGESVQGNANASVDDGNGSCYSNGYGSCYSNGYGSVHSYPGYPQVHNKRKVYVVKGTHQSSDAGTEVEHNPKEMVTSDGHEAATPADVDAAPASGSENYSATWAQNKKGPKNKKKKRSAAKNSGNVVDKAKKQDSSEADLSKKTAKEPYAREEEKKTLAEYEKLLQEKKKLEAKNADAIGANEELQTFSDAQAATPADADAAPASGSQNSFATGAKNKKGPKNKKRSAAKNSSNEVDKAKKQDSSEATAKEPVVHYGREEEKKTLAEYEKLLQEKKKLEAKNADYIRVNEELQKEVQFLRFELKRVKDDYEQLEEKCHDQTLISMKELNRVKKNLKNCEKRLEDAEKETVDAKKQVSDGYEIRKNLQNNILELKGNIRVFCRLRPLLLSECYNAQQGVSFLFPESLKSKGRGIDVINQGQKNSFLYDKVFDQDVSQEEVFKEISELVQSSLDGYKVGILAYGQTGSGKTYTMMGKGIDQKGIIPRSLDQIYSTIELLESQGWNYSIQASMFEIYINTFRDLLTPELTSKKQYTIQHDTDGNTYVPNLSVFDVSSAAHASDLLEKAMKMRSVGSTKMNSESSRSHFICTLKLFGSNKSSNKHVKGLLYLVDLAGSESLEKSGCTCAQLKETTAINKSLSSLSDVILAIANKEGHVPFRNSNLTYILEPCFGRDSKALMFVNISPLPSSVNETIASLKFGSRVNVCELRSR